MCELRHARARLGVDVERLLGQRERGRALVEQLAAPLLDLGAQAAGRHHLVDQAHRQRLLRRVLTAQIPDLARFLLAHHACQVPGAVAGVHAAHARARLAEHGRVGGDREVAEHVQHVAAADGEAVDHRDHRLGDVADRAVQRLHVHGALIPGIAAVPALLLVAAGAERLVAGAGQHDHADRRIPVCVDERVGQLGDGLRAEGVPHLRPVDRDPGDAVLLLVQDVGGRHVA